MFTGIVQEVGTVAALRRRGPSADVEVQCALASLVLGESVAVDGVCLTVTAVMPGGFRADVSAETLARTTLGAASRGDAVNIERALRVDDRLGGHIVAGHVDGVGAVRARAMSGEAERVEFDAPWEVLRFIAEKGSVAIDGASLTVNAVDARGFSVMLVPFTRGHTTLGAKPPGRAVNLEADVLARYVARALEAAKGPARSDEAWRALLDEHGFTR
jgi:riboflavin synthase